MVRNIIKIDEEKCNGCGICVNACHEGAIQLIDGKAKLVSESYCDGLGNCLPACPMEAITLEQREAAAFDEEAVKKNTGGNVGTDYQSVYAMQKKVEKPLACGCPGTHSKSIERKEHHKEIINESAYMESELMQWPVQIKLVPVNAPYFENANLLVAADCTAYAYANFHRDFIRNKITIIGCPKLDEEDYTEKLTEIISNNNIKSVTIVRMEVPCCGGLENAVKRALMASDKMIPWQVVTIGTDGSIIE